MKVRIDQNWEETVRKMNKAYKATSSSSPHFTLIQTKLETLLRGEFVKIFEFFFQ